MSTTMVIAAAALRERIHYLLPEMDHESQPIAKVKNGLLPMLEQLKHFSEVAGANHNLTDDQVNKDVVRIMKLCWIMEDLIESYLLEIASRRNRFLIMNFFKSWLRIKFIDKVSKELTHSIVHISKLSDSTPAIHQALEVEPVKADSIETEETVVGMDDAKRDLMSALTQGTSRLNVVVICGIGGIGKTTLAKKLYQDTVVEDKFYIRAWVCVASLFQESRVLLEILAKVSTQTHWTYREAVDMSDEELALNIYKNLKGQRYLIVLDDVWSADVWRILRLVFPDDNNGSRVLITTRSKEVATQVGGHIQYMDHLPQLFRDKLPLHGRNADGTLPLGLHLVSELPLEERNRVFDIIESCYNGLPLRLKPCLLYLGNFPKDTHIEWDAVGQLWIAEGLISMEQGEYDETMMDVAARYLNELARRNWLNITEAQDSGRSRFKSCRIDDLILEFCATKGKKDIFFEVMELGNKKENMSHLGRRAIYLDKFEYTHSELYGYVDADDLRSLLFFTSNQSEEGIIRPREIPDLDKFFCLRVLYLYGIDFMDGKLPKGLEELVLLRYLSFRQCYLEDLSSLVGNMFYLQTLDLRVRNECEMTIPDVLQCFTRLKYLYFPLAYCTLNHTKLRLGKLKELEILDNFDISLCNLEDLRELTNLRKLTVSTEGDISEIERILNTFEHYKSQFRSTSLNIRSFDCHSKRRYSTMEKVFKSSALHVLEVEGHLGKLPVFDRMSSELTEIILNGSELVEDPMQILHELPNLSILVLEYDAYIEEKMKCSSDFVKLRYLRLSMLYNLKHWEIEGKMPSLHTLVIEKCKNLQMLPGRLEGCKDLQKLEITSMPDAFVGRIQKSDATAGEDFSKIKHVPIVKIDGQHLILKERHQGPREDPQCSSSTI